MEETKRLFPLDTEYHTWQYLAKGEVSFLSKEKTIRFSKFATSIS
ncbi:hypothetical protein [Sphingobacterium sp. E70]|nr:hypothetical protein [Sphingobacterium sp. E70]